RVGARRQGGHVRIGDGPPVIILGQVVWEGRVGCAEAPVLTVGVDQVVVEADLAGGRVVCAGGGVGRLGRWGVGRRRAVGGVGRGGLGGGGGGVSAGCGRGGDGAGTVGVG